MQHRKRLWFTRLYSEQTSSLGNSQTIGRPQQPASTFNAAGGFCDGGFFLFCFVLQSGTISEEAGEELQQKQRRRVAWSFSAHDSCHKHKHTRGRRDGERYCEVTQVHRQVGVRHRQYRAYSLIVGFLYSFSYGDRK